MKRTDVEKVTAQHLAIVGKVGSGKTYTAKGFVERGGSELVATDAGIAALGSNFERLPTGNALREHWLSTLPGGERAVLRVVCESYPRTIEREEISVATGYKRSTRDRYLQYLGARALVDTERQGVRASPMLFDCAKPHMTHEQQPGFPFPAPIPHERDVHLSRAAGEFSSEFSAWLEMNPEIWREFCKIGDDMRARGREHYSAKAIVEVIRWHRAMRDPTEDVFKINNNWAPELARLYNAKHGVEFFLTRASPGEPFQKRYEDREI